MPVAIAVSPADRIEFRVVLRVPWVFLEVDQTEKRLDVASDARMAVAIHVV